MWTQDLQYKEDFVDNRSCVDRSNSWKGCHFVWSRQETWMPRLTSWLEPRFRADAERRLKPGEERDFYMDDPEWSRLLARCLRGDLEDHTAKLGQALQATVARTFHGCRTEDAGSYFREGVRVHDREEMTQRLMSLIESREELRWRREHILAEIAEEMTDIDIGRVYVVVDDRPLLEHAPLYMLYGSEWILAKLGPAGHHILLETGTPTLLEIDLPLQCVTQYERAELAAMMLREWTRFACNKADSTIPLEFTFALEADIPAACIVGHSHPAELPDALSNFQKRRSASLVCRHCAP